MKRKFFLYIIFFAAGIVAYNCRKELPNQPKANQLPTTRLWLQSDQTLLESSSRQHVFWYGEDPDGTISGYIVSIATSRLPNIQLPNPDTLTYFWTTKTDSIMPLPLLQARDSFTIVIRAVDNLFKNGALLEGAVIKMFPQPFWDMNKNGVSDSGDIALPSLSSSIDPGGAVQIFPLRNTPPTVYFIGDPTAQDTTLPIQQPLYT